MNYLPIAFAILVGCTSTKSVGRNADGGIDAFVPPDSAAEGGVRDRDAGGAPCQGLPPDCTLLSPERCSTVMGCLSTRCRGFALACDRRTMAECSNGCVWDGSTCTGTALPCGSLSDEQCPDQVGCALSPFAACGGVGVACETLPVATCTMQLGCSVSPCVPGEGTAVLEFRVVTDRVRRVALEGAHIRAEARCSGDVIETVTDATGNVSISLDRRRGSWDLTVANEYYNAVSIIDVADAESIGEIYIERDHRLPGPSHYLSGVVRGTVPAGHTVVVSASSAATYGTPIDVSGEFFTSFDAVPEFIGAAIDIVALELDDAGRAVNIAVETREIVDADIEGVELVLPDSPVPWEEISYRIDATSVVFDEVPEMTRVLHDAPGWFGRNGVMSGTATVTPDGAGALVTVRTFPTAISSDYVIHFLTIDGGFAEVIQHDLVRPETIRVPAGTNPMLEGEGGDGNVEEVIVFTRGRRDPDEQMVLELMPSGASVPAWRIFAPTVPSRFDVPALPSMVDINRIAWHPADPFKAGGRGDDAHVYFVRMRGGMHPWSSPHTSAWGAYSQSNKRPDWIYSQTGDSLGYHRP